MLTTILGWMVFGLAGREPGLGPRPVHTLVPLLCLPSVGFTDRLIKSDRRIPTVREMRAGSAQGSTKTSRASCARDAKESRR